MKNIRVEDITEQMLKELAKKSSMKEDKFLDELVSRLYMDMKKTESGHLRTQRQDLTGLTDTITVLQGIIKTIRTEQETY